MARMRAEADHLGADGIVGVQLRMQRYVWGQDVLEFIATGTAVRALGSGGTGTAGAPPGPGGPGLPPGLSAPDFFRRLAPRAGPGAFVLRARGDHIAPPPV